MSPALSPHRLFHTLRHLKPSQLLFFVVRRALPARRVQFVGGSNMRGELSLLPLVSQQTFLERDGERSFYCHNQSVVFRDADIDWRPTDQTRLWCYNLHYFDTLRDTERSIENKCWLIESWVAQNPQNSQPAWEPFTVSLRIVNWVAFFIKLRSSRDIPQSWMDSLHEQVQWLDKNDERHILANHYFENIKAWCFAGFFFSGAYGNKWLSKGQKLLEAQLKEQFLQDGAHYERSPQYHSIVLAGCLDLLNLARCNPDYFSKDMTLQLLSTIEKGLRWLAAIVRPDRQIPLFNDSSFGVGPTFSQLEVYAAPLNVSLPQVESTTVINEKEGGIYGYRGGQDWLAIKCGEVGPAYQPGHTNCDLLSYELVLNELPIVVDTGVYEYEPGELRRYVRSTAAHNTCSANDDDQSEVWGEFRVARRAKIKHADISWQASDQQHLQFSGAYSGFFAVRGGAEHLRTVDLELDESGNINSIAVADEVTGAGVESVQSFIHFHPDLQVVQREGRMLELCLETQLIARIYIAANLEYSLQPSIYCPEFGKKYSSKKIVMQADQQSPAQLSYRIEKV